jgi:predicted outer membrane repeat protein
LGGAIINDEKMIISDCEFENNSSGGVGGAIAATFTSDLQIIKSKFTKNSVNFDIYCPGIILPSDAQGFGGAIYNNGKLDISESEFMENNCGKNGGAMIVLPDSVISIEKSLFKDNHAKVDGGVIHTMGDINISDSEFTRNSADGAAGVFDATKSSKLKISNSKFKNNTAEKGNVIVNKGELKLIETEISDGDIVDESFKVDETQPALPDENDAVDDEENEAVNVESGEDESGTEFPEGYEDYAREFKEIFEEMLEDKDFEGQSPVLILKFAVWAQRFPKDANLVAAALLMAKGFDVELVKTILDDFSQEEYNKRLTEYEPIDEEAYSWFLAVALLGMTIDNSNDDMDSNG